MRLLKEMLKDRELFVKEPITLFFDIETYQYNEAAAKNAPSLYCNMTYSVAVSWIDNQGEIEYEVFPNFKEFFDEVIGVYGGKAKKPRIILNAHNTNKYDNHFMQYDLLHYYPHMTVENFYLNTGTTEESNIDALKIKDLRAAEKRGIILEKRIKSSINLEMVFFLYGVQFETQDNYMKTNSSVKMLGEKLLRLGVLTKDELKTDFDYLKYNRPGGMTEEEARNYASIIYNNLTPDELTYIRNDVIILAKSVYHYSDLFKGFDYSKRTFTSNILDAYNTNDLTSFQLLNRFGKGKDKYEVRYTDYQFANQNFYDYLKPFYRGGLNFYNHRYVGKIVTEGVFSMDIHSSYPFAMHNFKIPTYLKSHEQFDQPTEIPIDYTDDEFTLFQLSKDTFDNLILDMIDSVLLKQILVKYYSTNEFVNVNTYTFKLIENVVGIRFESIPVHSTVTFETEYFGSRDQIEEFYKIKTQGKYEYKLDFKSPYDITITDTINTVLYSSEEILIAKTNMNGLYGIPALRPYFNLFRKDAEGDYYNVENGHKNAERNIVFSIFVTSVSLWNLLNPLKYLTQHEIDENLLYIDTDSLYMKSTIFDKMDKSLFTDFHLGTWGLDHVNLKNFYILNHKKYCYEAYNKKTGLMDIVVKSGGIPHNSFDLSLPRMPFDLFIKTQFSAGVELKTLKSIYNKQKTISLYPATTKLEAGRGYRIMSGGKLYEDLKQQIFQEVRDVYDPFTDEGLYVETIIGTYSISDIYPFTHEIKQKEPLIFLEIYQERIKELINS